MYIRIISIQYGFMIKFSVYNLSQGLSHQVHKKLRFVPTVIYVDGEWSKVGRGGNTPSKLYE